MTRTAQRYTAFSSVLAVLLSLPLLAWFGARSTAAAPLDAPSSPASLKLLLTRAGLDPRSLAAAGVSAQQVSSIAGAIAAHVAQFPNALRAADEALTQARAAHDALERKVGAGLANESEVAALAAARQALASASTQRAAALNALHQAGASVLTSEQRTRLATLRANAGKPGGIELKAAARSEAEWLALRNALSNERSCASSGDAPHSGCQTLLSAARSNASVAAAKSALDANLASIRSAWSTSVGG